MSQRYSKINKNIEEAEKQLQETTILYNKVKKEREWNAGKTTDAKKYHKEIVEKYEKKVDEEDKKYKEEKI